MYSLGLYYNKYYLWVPEVIDINVPAWLHIIHYVIVGT